MCATTRKSPSSSGCESVNNVLTTEVSKLQWLTSVSKLQIKKYSPCLPLLLALTILRPVKFSLKLQTIKSELYILRGYKSQNYCCPFSEDVF